MRISLLFRGGRSKPEVKKAEEIKEYANIFAFFGWKKQAGSKKKQRKSRNMRISLLFRGGRSKPEEKRLRKSNFVKISLIEKREN